MTKTEKEMLGMLVAVIERAEKSIRAKHMEHYDSATLRVLETLQNAALDEMYKQGDGDE